MQKVIIFINIILFFSCSFLPESVGKENEIIIITSPEDRPLIENLMSDLFSQVIYTPQPEPEFSLHFRNPWELDDVQEYGNILITSLDFPQDSTGDYLMHRILQANSQNASVFTLSDLYAKNQIICGIHTQDAISMEKELELKKMTLIPAGSFEMGDHLDRMANSQLVQRSQRMSPISPVSGLNSTSLLNMGARFLSNIWLRWIRL